MSEETNVVEMKKPETEKKALSALLHGIAQVLLAGTYPGTHAKIVIESVDILDKLSSIEAAREAELAEKKDA